MQNAHIIETALLLLIAFLIGCAIGWFVRTRFYGAGGASSGSSGVKTPQTAAPIVAPAAATAPVETPAAATPVAANKAPAAKKAPAVRKPAAAVKKPASKKPAAIKPATPKAPAKLKAPAVAEAGKPEGLSAPRAGGKDDLKRISGVGPKLEEKLNELGVYHFDQIAGWNRQTIDWVDDHLSFKGRIARDKWVAQAKTMAKE